jgi:hypothetical protein
MPLALSPKAVDFASAALRHMRDAEHLLDAGPNASQAIDWPEAAFVDQGSGQPTPSVTRWKKLERRLFWRRRTAISQARSPRRCRCWGRTALG